jgi:NADH dehydrogenase [ubiquinone] 1 alpha subcomplex assembly factor 1
VEKLIDNIPHAAQQASQEKCTMVIAHQSGRINGPAVWACVIVLAAHLVSAQTEATELSSVHTSQTRVQTRLLVEEAIALGVPLFNDGQPDACAAIYRITLRSLQLLAPASAERQIIEPALRAAAEQDSERAAWTLRYALDAVYLGTERAALMTDETGFRIDFADAKSVWYSVNDNVMGGVSRGGLTESDDGMGRFTGQLSMRNNGGFSSVRTQVANASLAGYDGVEMRVLGDGRQYKLLAAPSNARGSWQGDFRASQDWQTIRVPFKDMELSVRGWRPSNAPTLTGRDIGMLGLLVADKQTRPFRLEIDWIQGFVYEVATTQ